MTSGSLFRNSNHFCSSVALLEEENPEAGRTALPSAKILLIDKIRAAQRRAPKRDLGCMRGLLWALLIEAVAGAGVLLLLVVWRYCSWWHL